MIRQSFVPPRTTLIVTLAVVLTLGYWQPTSSEILANGSPLESQTAAPLSPSQPPPAKLRSTPDVADPTQGSLTPKSGAETPRPSTPPVQSITKVEDAPKRPQQSAGQLLRAGDKVKISFYETLDVARGTQAGTSPQQQDVLRTFYQRIDLTGEYTIGASGMIDFPLLGMIKADGLRTGDLRSIIAARFKRRMLREGDINVTILQRQPIYVVGLANNSGAYEIVPDMMVLHALALAGGLKREQIDADLLSQSVTEVSRVMTSKVRLARLRARRGALTAPV